MDFSKKGLRLVSPRGRWLGPSPEISSLHGCGANVYGNGANVRGGRGRALDQSTSRKNKV